MLEGARPTRAATLRWRAVVIATALPPIGLWLNDALVSEPRLADGFAIATFHAMLAVPVLTVACGIALAGWAWLMDVRRGGRGAAWVVGPGAVIGLALLGSGLLDHVPTRRFERYVLSLRPPSLADLRIAKADSFGDGYSWTFAFHIAPADFASIQQAFALGPPTAVVDVGDGAPDRLLARDAGGVYRRPAGGVLFRGRDRTTVVTNAARSDVYVYRDF